MKPVPSWVVPMSIALALLAQACGGASRAPDTASTRAEHGPRQQAAAGGSPRPDYSKLPGPSATVEFAPPAPELLELSNQLPIYFKRQGTAPLVVLALVVPRGSGTDPPGKAGLTALTIDLLDEGAGTRTALELSNELQRLGTDFSALVDVDGAVLLMNALADNLAPSAAILGDIVRRPALSPAEFERRKALRIAAAIEAESAPAYAREVVLHKALFGAGYGGDLPGGTSATLANITYGDVKRHYRALMAPEQSAFVVVGGIEGASAHAALERAFAGWQSGGELATPAPVRPVDSAHALHFVEYPNAPQSAIAVARRAGGVHARDFFPALVFNRAFGGAFGSRLNLNLRESKGYTYGARSSFVRWEKAGYFALSADVVATATSASIEAMLDELSDLCTRRPIDARERYRAVEGLLLGFPGRWERAQDAVSELVELPLHDRPLDWYEKWPARVFAVDHPEASAVAREYCDTSRYAIVVAGDRRPLEPTELEIVAYDARGRLASETAPERP